MALVVSSVIAIVRVQRHGTRINAISGQQLNDGILVQKGPAGERARSFIS